MSFGKQRTSNGLDCFFYQKHLRCLGSRLVTFAARERYGSDRRVDGGETVGNRGGWTEGKPCAWGELRGEGARWKRRQGGRRGNSLGRAPLGRSEMEARIGWTEGKSGK